MDSVAKPPEDVIYALRAWSAAKDKGEATKRLRSSWLEMTAVGKAKLVQELVEISTDLLICILATDLQSGSPAAHVFGIAVSHDQVRRVGAWQAEQAGIASAFGVDVKSWVARIEARIEKLLPAHVNRSGPSDNFTLMQSFSARSFENRSEPHQSKRAGLSGLLAARMFDAPK